MKNYIIIEQIKANPMSLGEYYKYKGYTVPDINKINAKGYIIYHSDGCVSWRPEAVFNKNCLEILEEDKITGQDVDNFIKDTDVVKMGDKTTVVQATFRNGFNMVSGSSSVTPENFNMEIGRQCCIERIKDHAWELLGFLLQSARNGFNGDKK